MAKEDLLTIEGKIKKALPGGKFETELITDQEVESKVVLCTVSGKIRKNNIRLVVGDHVDVSLSPYDLNAGIITWRYRE